MRLPQTGPDVLRDALVDAPPNVLKSAKTPLRSLHQSNGQRAAKVVLTSLALFIGLLLTFRPSVAQALDTFSDDITKLGGLTKQIEGDEKEIQELIERKKLAEDKSSIDEIVRDLVKKHADLKRISQEYEQLRLHIRFKHPEKNETVERKYVHYKLKTLTEMESSFGIDGRLDRTKTKVMTIFPLPVAVGTISSESVFAKSRNPASEDSSADSKESDIDMPGRILLRR